MAGAMRRVHLEIPEEVLAEVDALVGPRQRSQFVTAVVREKLDRLRLRRLAREAAGSLAGVDVPGWETPEAADAWLRELRHGWDRRLDGWLPEPEGR